MKTIIVYTTESCSGCVNLKKALSRNFINYEYVDISTDDSARELLISKGITSVPCIRVINENDSEEFYNMAYENLNNILSKLR